MDFWSRKLSGDGSKVLWIFLLITDFVHILYEISCLLAWERINLWPHNYQVLVFSMDFFFLKRGVHRAKNFHLTTPILIVFKNQMTD